MTGVLVLFMVVVIVPLFVATWRTSLLGLSLQGILIAWVAIHHETVSLATVLTVADLVILRSLVAPMLLGRVMRRKNAPPRNDVIAPNLLSWAIAISLVVVAFRSADALIPEEGDAQTLLAVSCVAFILGLFVLSTARGTFSQIIGVLRIENAIALFELGGPGGSIEIRAGASAVLLVSILLFRWYLSETPSEDVAPPGGESAVL